VDSGSTKYDGKLASKENTKLLTGWSN